MLITIIYIVNISIYFHCYFKGHLVFKTHIIAETINILFTQLKILVSVTFFVHVILSH